MPSDALAIAPAILAVVLTMSAVGKLRSPKRSLEAFRDLRVPAPLRASPVVRALPWAELLLALLLVVAGGWLGVVATVAAALLFTVYLLLVVRALGFDVPVDCACFGEFAPGRITRRTVVRNAWLVGLGVMGIVAALPGASLLAKVIDGNAPWWWLAAAGAAAITTVLIAGSSPAADESARTPDPAMEDLGEYVRTRTPALPVTLADGTATDLRRLSAQRAQLLLYVSEGCGGCQDVIDAAPRWHASMPQIDVRLVVEFAPAASSLASTDIPMTAHDPDRLVRDSFGVTRVPSAILLGADGLLAGGPVAGRSAVEDFVTEVKHELHLAPDDLSTR